VLRGRKSGFAPVGMTILLQGNRFGAVQASRKSTPYLCHPDRSEA
jgi:hypothetical protein